MKEQEDMSECDKFLNNIAHPNEQILAREIIEGKKLDATDPEDRFSLAFDKEQIASMTLSLENIGCIVSKKEEETQKNNTVKKAGKSK